MESVSPCIFIYLFFCFVLCTWCELQENTGNPHEAVTLNLTPIVNVIPIYRAPHPTVTGGQECRLVTLETFRENAKAS